MIGMESPDERFHIGTSGRRLEILGKPGRKVMLQQFQPNYDQSKKSSIIWDWYLRKTELKIKGWRSIKELVNIPTPTDKI
jgi:hypothetical protein